MIAIFLKIVHLKLIKMKITLKLSAKQLGAFVFQSNCINAQPINHREIKVARSVIDKILLKFRKKYLEVQNLPTKNRKGQIIKYTFSFEYYEAHFLEKCSDLLLAFPMSEYDRNVLNLIKSNLNQQLA